MSFKSRGRAALEFDQVGNVAHGDGCAVDVHGYGALGELLEGDRFMYEQIDNPQGIGGIVE